MFLGAFNVRIHDIAAFAKKKPLPPIFEENHRGRGQSLPDRNCSLGIFVQNVDLDAL